MARVEPTVGDVVRRYNTTLSHRQGRVYDITHDGDRAWVAWFGRVSVGLSRVKCSALVVVPREEQEPRYE